MGLERHEYITFIVVQKMNNECAFHPSRAQSYNGINNISHKCKTKIFHPFKDDKMF